MRPRYFLLAALLVLPSIVSLIATTPVAMATGQVTGLNGAATYFHTTLGWNAVSDADAYKVFVSKTGTTYPANYSQTALVQQTYTDVTDAVNIASGTYTNGNALNAPSVQSVAADATKPLITLVRFSISPNGGASCGPITVKIATADYSLGGTTWNTAKEVAGVSFTLVNGGATDTPTDMTVDFTTGLATFSGGTGWSPNTYTYTGIAGAASTFSGPARVGANAAYVQITGGNANCLIKTDTANPYAGGNIFTSSAGTYTSVAGTDFYHFRVQRSPGAAPTPPTKFLAGLVFASTYHFRVLASSLATGDATISDDLAMTMPDNSIAVEEVYALTLGTSGGSTCGTSTNSLPVVAGHAYIITVGANVGNQNQVVSGSVTGQYFNAQNSGTLIGVNAASGATLLNWQVNGNANAWTVYFVAQNTETINYFCSLNGSQTNWSPTTDCNRLPGCLGGLLIGGFTGWLFDAQLSKISETGVLSGCTSCPEATKSPTTTQFAWTQVANDQVLVNVGTFDNSATAAGLQSFTPAPTTTGTFLDTSTFRLQQSASGCNGATITWAVGTSNAYPWDTTSERGNFTSTITSTSSATTTQITIDWANGLISNSAPFTFGTPTVKANGVTMTIGSASFLSNFPITTVGPATLYLHWNVQGAPGTCLVMFSSTSQYAGGTVYTDVGGTWTQQAAADLSGWVMNVYGGVPITYSVSTTLADAGGAFYAYMCEVQKDATPQQYNFTSSFGGRAKATGFQAVGNAICASPVIGAVGATNLQQTIQEWRLGYDTMPHNATATLTVSFDTTGASRNLIYVGIFAGTQPSHPHVVGPGNATAAGYNNLNFYRILTTDDFFTQLTFTVYECANSDCTTFGNVSTTAAYLITICPGAFQRQASGNVNATGNIVVVGQDIPQCQVTITLSGLGYSSTTWTNSIGSAGTYTFNVGVFFAVTSGGNFTLGALSVTFSGNFSRINPDTINITINRTRADDLYVDCVRLDPNTGAVRSACTVDEWPPTDTNTYQRSLGVTGFVYPQSIRTTTNSGDIGTYVVFVINATGYWFGDHAFCIGANWASIANCSATIGTDLRTQLAVDSLNEATAAQRDLAQAQAAVSETTVRQHYLDMLDFALAPFAPCTGTTVPGAASEPGCTVPNIAWWYLGTLIIAGVGVARGGRRQ